MCFLEALTVEEIRVGCISTVNPNMTDVEVGEEEGANVVIVVIEVD